jgi:hypothetical protein
VYPVHWDTAIIIKVANKVRTDDIIHRNLNVDTPAIEVDPDLQELRLSQVQQAQTADRFVDMIGESDSSDEPSDDDASRRLSMSDHHPLASSHHELKDEGKYEEEESEEDESEEEYEKEEEDDEEKEEEDEMYFLHIQFLAELILQTHFYQICIYLYVLSIQVEDEDEDQLLLQASIQQFEEAALEQKGASLRDTFSVSDESYLKLFRCIFTDPFFHKAFLCLLNEDEDEGRLLEQAALEQLELEA